ERPRRPRVTAASQARSRGPLRAPRGAFSMAARQTSCSTSSARSGSKTRLRASARIQPSCARSSSGRTASSSALMPTEPRRRGQCDRIRAVRAGPSIAARAPLDPGRQLDPWRSGRCTMTTGRKDRRRAGILRISVLLALAAAPGRAAVLKVDASGGGFTDIQAAVNAAQSGDTIVVKADSYLPFVIDGKGLRLVVDLD